MSPTIRPKRLSLLSQRPGIQDSKSGLTHRKLAHGRGLQPGTLRLGVERGQSSLDSKRQWPCVGGSLGWEECGPQGLSPGRQKSSLGKIPDRRLFSPSLGAWAPPAPVHRLGEASTVLLPNSTAAPTHLTLSLLGNSPSWPLSAHDRSGHPSRGRPPPPHPLLQL